MFSTVHAQSETENHLSIKMDAAVGSDNAIPFWIRHNNRGIFSENETQFLTRLEGIRSGEITGHLEYSLGAEVGFRRDVENSLWIQQGFLKLQYRDFELSAGKFYQYSTVPDPLISSGSFGISRNARPMPKILAGFTEYTDVPFLNGFVQIRGHIAHGWFDDDRYTENPWLHEKSGYLKFGKAQQVLNFYGGLNHYGIWNGISPDYGNMPGGWDNFRRIFFVLQPDQTDKNLPPSDSQYLFGDSKGVWDIGIELELSGLNLDATLYRQIPLEDRDGIKFKSPQDGLWGLHIAPDNSQSFISSITYEFIYTKWQNGPEGLDVVRGGKGGRDNYYNHGIYQSGWAYNNMSLGSPLFSRQTLPYDLYERGFINNRIIAHHLGFHGIHSNLSYNFQVTLSRNYGTYGDEENFSENNLRYPYSDGPFRLNSLIEFNLSQFLRKNISLNFAIAYDNVELSENFIGILTGFELNL